MVEEYGLKNTLNISFNEKGVSLLNVATLKLNDEIIWESPKATKGLVYVPCNEGITSFSGLSKVTSSSTYSSSNKYYSYDMETNKFTLESVSSTEEISGLYYTTSTTDFSKDTGYYWIISYSGTDSDVIIPKEMNGNKIIGTNNIFYGNTSVTSVKVLADIKRLADSMFYGCTSLINVKLPNSLERIGHSAFMNCSALDFELPDNIRSIGKDAFTGSLLLSNTPLTNGVYKHKTYIIGADTSLTTATIDEDITACIERCFSLCPLTTINFNATNMGDAEDSYFGGYSDEDELSGRNITSYTIGPNVKRLAGYMFDAICWLEYSSGQPSSYGYYSFSTKFEIPESVETIGKDAFNAPTASAISVTSSASVFGKDNYSEDSPFIVPKRIKNIEDGAFTFAGFGYIDFQTEEIKKEWFSGASGYFIFPYIKVGDNITEIPDGCLQGVVIKKIEIGKNVSKIGAKAFVPNSNYGSSPEVFVFSQPSGMSVELPTSGSSTGLAYFKSAREITIYTDNEDIKNYDWSGDNVTATFYHLDGSAWE